LFYYFATSIDKGTPHWFKYFLCGIKGVLECNEATSVANWNGLNARIYGLVPASAGMSLIHIELERFALKILLKIGLSSSSALVCSAALAFAHVNQLPLSKQQLADLCAKSERYNGKNSSNPFFSYIYCFSNV